MTLPEKVTEHWTVVIGRGPTDAEASDLMALIQAEGEAKVLTCLSGYLEFRPKEQPGTVDSTELIAFLGVCAGAVR